MMTDLDKKFAANGSLLFTVSFFLLIGGFIVLEQPLFYFAALGSTGFALMLMYSPKLYESNNPPKLYTYIAGILATIAVLDASLTWQYVGEEFVSWNAAWLYAAGGLMAYKYSVNVVDNKYRYGFLAGVAAFTIDFLSPVLGYSTEDFFLVMLVLYLIATVSFGIGHYSAYKKMS